MKVLVINGPNLNLLGEREPDVYGQNSLSSINLEIENHANTLGIDVSFFQSNHEGELIDNIHSARKEFNGIVLNAGAFTHYSYAIRDAISAIEIPVVEVHLSNVHSREEFRNKSVIAPVCVGTISGFGKTSYSIAIEALQKILK